MKLIPLTGKYAKGRSAMVDDDMYYELNKHKWFYANPNGRTTGYASRTVRIRVPGLRKYKFKRIHMHRFIMKTPSDMMVDHRDHNGLNCQRYNMRNCTNSQNGMNRTAKRNCSSRYLGVSWRRANNKWAVRIKIKGKIKHIGLFSNEDDAAVRYNKEAKKHYGKFANFNTIKKGE